MAFSLIIHVIVFKLFLESVFWNWIATLTGLVCLIVYYGMVIGLNIDMFATIFQPELNGEILLMLGSAKAWFCLIVLPAVALLPDLAYTLI